MNNMFLESRYLYMQGDGKECEYHREGLNSQDVGL